MKVLVAGEGAVAAATVSALLERGHEVRLLSPGAGIRAEVIVEAAAATLVDRLLASAAGGVLEDLDWVGALERIVEISGGRAPAGVQRDEHILDADEADDVRRRSERLRDARQRGRAPRAASGPATPARLTAR